MKPLWIKLILVITFAASGNSLSFAQPPGQLPKKSDERIEKKGDVETYQSLETNLPKHKNEVYIARNRMNWLTWKQSQLDRIGTALSRERTPENAFFGKEDASTDQLTNGETLILTRGTQPFLHCVPLFLKTAGKSLIAGGIFSIFFIYILLLLVILLRVSYTNKREWSFVL